MKLAQLTNQKFKEALQRLIAQPLPLKAAFKLKGIIKKVDEELVKFEEVRNAGVQKHGNKKEDGVTLDVQEDGNVNFTPENIKLYVEELNELTSMDVELDSLSIDELGEKVEVTAADLLILDGIIK